MKARDKRTEIEGRRGRERGRKKETNTHRKIDQTDRQATSHTNTRTRKIFNNKSCAKEKEEKRSI